MYSSGMFNRIIDGYNDIRVQSMDNLTTSWKSSGSIIPRIIIWQGSLNMIKQEPYWGIGLDKFNENLVEQIKDKKILLIGLDTRYFRSSLEGEKRNYQSTSDVSKTILGQQQWEWLERTFQNEADIIILVSSIQILATNHGFEKWSNFPHEKERLLSLIKQFKKPVVLVSGDRHKAGIYKQDNLYENIKLFFDLPDSIKSKYEFQGFKGQRGYTSFGKEHAKGKKEGRRLQS